MKKHILFLSCCLMLTTSLSAQKCKFAKIRASDQAVQITKKTKMLPIAEKGLNGINGQFYIQNGDLYLSLYYNSQIKKKRTIKSSDPIVWQTASGEKIEVFPIRDAESSFIYQGILSTTNFDIKLAISPELLTHFQNTTFQEVHFITHLKKGGQQTETLKVKPSFLKKLQHGATCIKS